VAAGPEQAAQKLGEIKAGKLIASRTAVKSPMALLMHMAMVCSDDPVHSVEDVITDGVGQYAALFGQAGARQYAELCALISVEELPDATDAEVTADIPVLLLSGDLDVATPTFRSQTVADALPNATLVDSGDQCIVHDRQEAAKAQSRYVEKNQQLKDSCPEPHAIPFSSTTAILAMLTI